MGYNNGHTMTETGQYQNGIYTVLKVLGYSEENGGKQSLFVKSNDRTLFINLFGHTKVADAAVGKLVEVTAGKGKRSGVIVNEDSGNLAVFKEAKVNVLEKSGGEKVTTKTETSVVTRETYRTQAEESVRANLRSAVNISADTLKGQTVDLIALADLVGRTMTAITIDAQRNR